MILTMHSVVGAAIANQISNPWIAWLSAFISHFVLDSIPHREYSLENAKYGWKSKKFWILAVKILIDLLAGFAFIIIFTQDRSNLPKNIIAGFAGLIPDGLTVLYYITKKKDINQFFSNTTVQRAPLFGGSFWRTINKGLEKFYFGFHKKFHVVKMPRLLWGIANQLIIFLTALLSFYK